MGTAHLTTSGDAITSVAYANDTELPPMVLVGVNDALADVPPGATWTSKTDYKFTHELPEDEIERADTLIEILQWLSARLDAGAGSLNPTTSERADEEYEEYEESKGQEEAERAAREAALEREAYDDENIYEEDDEDGEGAAAKKGPRIVDSGVSALQATPKSGPESYIHGALTEVWRSQESVIKDWSTDPGGLEEQWAQLFSELFSGSNYDGCGEGYVMGEAAPRFWDEYIYSRLQSRVLPSASYKEGQAPPVGCSIESWENPVMNVLSRAGYDALKYEDNDDPAAPMCCACQYLATFGLITRGFRIELRAKQIRSMQEVVGLSAAPAVGVPVFSAPGGAWVWRDNMRNIRLVTNLTNPVARDPLPEEENPPPAPPAISRGTVFTYHKLHQLVNHPLVFEVMPGTNPSDDIKKRLENEASGKLSGAETVAKSVKAQEQAKLDAAIKAGKLPGGTKLAKITTGLTGQPGGSHIMHVFRIHPSGQKVQLFDSNGGNNSRTAMNKEKRGDVLDPGLGINMDTASFSFIPGDSSPNGMGVPRSAPDLAGQIEMMKRARPIGLARLVLTRRENLSELMPEHVLFVSRLLRTYGDAEHQNYTVARYLWSLRNTPGFGSIQPFWLTFLPRGILARAMWARGARTAKLSDFVAAHEGIFEAWEKEKAMKKRQPGQTLPLLDWRDLGKGRTYEITTNYRDAQILTNIVTERGAHAQVARNVVSSPDGAGAELLQRGMQLPRAFTQPLPGVPGDRNIILPPETVILPKKPTEKKTIFRENHRIIAWDFMYVKEGIDGADRLRALDEPGLEYFKVG